MEQFIELPIRQSARLVILDSDDRLLLMQIQLDTPADPNAPITKPYWVTLGGGVKSGETLEQTASRELKEETGLQCAIGPIIWHGRWKQGNKRIHDETFFLIRLFDKQETLDHSGLEEEKSVIKNIKWWDVKALQESGEILIPKDLISLIQPLINDPSLLPKKVIEIDLSTPQ